MSIRERGALPEGGSAAMSVTRGSWLASNIRMGIYSPAAQDGRAPSRPGDSLTVGLRKAANTVWLRLGTGVRQPVNPPRNRESIR